MGFSLDSVMTDVEYRGYRQNTSTKTGQLYMTAYFESQDETSIRLNNLSVPADKRQEFLSMTLRKGEVCTVAVKAVAGDGYSYMKYDGIISRSGLSEDSDALSSF